MESDSKGSKRKLENRESLLQEYDTESQNFADYLKTIGNIKCNDGIVTCRKPCDVKKLSLETQKLIADEPCHETQERFYKEISKLSIKQKNILLRFPLKSKIPEIIRMISSDNYGDSKKLKYNLPRKYGYKKDSKTSENFLVNLKGLKIISFEDLFKTIHGIDVINNHPPKEKLREMISSMCGNITKDMVTWYRQNVCYHCMAIDDSRRLLKKLNREFDTEERKASFTGEFEQFTAQSMVNTSPDLTYASLRNFIDYRFGRELRTEFNTIKIEKQASLDAQACGGLLKLLPKTSASTEQNYGTEDVERG